MTLSAVLNSDLGTTRAILVNGFHWWTGQLRELIPGRLQRDTMPRHIVAFDGTALSVVRGQRSPNDLPAEGTRVALAVPARQAFLRTLKLPGMRPSDLSRLVAIEAERLSPLPPPDSLAAAGMRRRASDAGHAPVEIAVLPKSVAEQALAAAERAGLVVAAFGLLDEPDPKWRIDFMPALRAAGMAPPHRSPAAIWWVLVGLFLLVNLAVHGIRDRREIARLSAMVEEQGPAVTTARAMLGRTNAFDAGARVLSDQRRTHDVLGTLAIVSASLPEGAWVQRMSYNGPTVRLVGYKRKGVDLIAAFKRDARIAGVRSNMSQMVAEIATGEPFDVTIQLRIFR